MLVVSSCSSIALSNVKKLNIIKVLQEKKKDIEPGINGFSASPTWPEFILVMLRGKLMHKISVIMHVRVKAAVDASLRLLIWI